MMGDLNNIETDTGRTYKIWISRVVVDDDNPDNIGLNRITLCKKDGTRLLPIGEVSDYETFYEY